MSDVLNLQPYDNRLVGVKIAPDFESWDYGGYFLIKYVGLEYVILEDSRGREHIRARQIPFSKLPTEEYPEGY